MKHTINLLKEKHQEHIIPYLQNADETAATILIEEISKIDWDIFENQNSSETSFSDIEPINICSINDINIYTRHYQSLGENAIKKDKLALVLLAGGQGTRLGYAGPKGAVDVGITHSVYIFELLIQNLLKIVTRTNHFIPLYIMTSVSNHEETLNFFKSNQFFGYDCNYVHFFIQESNPTTDFNGKLLVNEDNHLIQSPNGNGGWFLSMYNQKLIDDIFLKNFEWINVFSVDNVLQQIADPVFLGAVIDHKCACGAKVVKKVDSNEKVGAICKKNNKPYIIEYYELEAAYKNGNISDIDVFNYGVTLNYLFQVSALMDTLKLDIPIHKVSKKIPYMNELHESVIPEKENGYKYETLALDLVHMMDSCLAFEVDRTLEFAPIKNKEGRDSISTAQELLIRNGYEL